MLIEIAKDFRPIEAVTTTFVTQSQMTVGSFRTLRWKTQNEAIRTENENCPVSPSDTFAPSGQASGAASSSRGNYLIQAVEANKHSVACSTHVAELVIPDPDEFERKITNHGNNINRRRRNRTISGTAPW